MGNAESVAAPNPAEQLEQVRLLSEVDHLLAYRRGAGLYDVQVLDDVRTNLSTALQEMAMPAAVTTTFQRVHYETDETGRRQRLYKWLGMTAVEVAESGRKFHTSQAALDRVEVEVAEAVHSQETLTTGRAQIFISPKMSSRDAPRAVAVHEHLADDDAVRVSYLATDGRGRVRGRRMESLLVRDIPLDAWVAMLKDPYSVFGRSFELADEVSALSVMELFRGLELPEVAVPEGPVSLVQAVLAYVEDGQARASVERQLDRFRKDQALYRQKAEQMAEEWLAFELTLADSLHSGWATPAIRAFIASFQHNWGPEQLRIITAHQEQDGEYTMTRQLASVLEGAERHLLAATAAIVTGNEEVIRQIGVPAAEAIRHKEAEISRKETAGCLPEVILLARAELYRQVAGKNVQVGGGCAGVAGSAFQAEGSPAEGASTRSNASKEDWKWTTGVCRFKNYPLPHSPEVGPCHICRSCQRLFDAGLDPTKAARKPAAKQKDFAASMAGLWRGAERREEARQSAGQRKDRRRELGGLLLAA